MQIHISFSKDEIEESLNISFDSDKDWSNFIREYKCDFEDAMYDAVAGRNMGELVENATQEGFCRNNLDDEEGWIGIVGDDEIGVKCDNKGCIGGRAWQTDESAELDSKKMFCSPECADEHVNWVVGSDTMLIMPKKALKITTPTTERASRDS